MFLYYHVLQIILYYLYENLAKVFHSETKTIAIRNKLRRKMLILNVIKLHNWVDKIDSRISQTNFILGRGLQKLKYWRNLYCLIMRFMCYHERVSFGENCSPIPPPFLAIVTTCREEFPTTHVHPIENSV